ncbi:hypothetical protein CK623_01690 [Vandammella animalimorsus]|uniref:Uncharacterized protein n=2 Tax=Vandammella animalimorsus TaxID=2029117 RepID=A0A2A2AV88_9BURK|nr:hypothetical protein CK623_01690 [Vandammella animalimorsus]
MGQYSWQLLLCHSKSGIEPMAISHKPAKQSTSSQGLLTNQSSAYNPICQSFNRTYSSISPPPTHKMPNFKRRHQEFWTGLADAAPFFFSIFISFVMFGVLGREMGFNGLALAFMTGSIMSEPLQLTLLKTSLESLTIAGIAVAALSANLRFVAFTLSIKNQLSGPIHRHVPALMVMANAAYTLIALRQQASFKVTPQYTNAVCFSLYGAALLGTVVGFTIGAHFGDSLSMHAASALIIFLFSQIGKMLLDRNILFAILISGSIGALQIVLWGATNLTLSLIGTILLTYSYDRS